MQCGVTVAMEKERAIGNVSAVECCSKNFGRSIKKDTRLVALRRVKYTASRHVLAETLICAVCRCHASACHTDITNSVTVYPV